MTRTWSPYGVFFLVIFSTVFCRGQQHPMFTQYMFNGLVLNPAYAGTQETFFATAVLRKQWVGIAGAPQTQTFSAHSPMDGLRNDRRARSPVSLGVTFFNDQIAITGHSGLLGAYAYRVEFLNGSILSMGLQAGFSQLRIRYSELELDDPSFVAGDISEWQPEFGAGLYFRTSRFYGGLSAPQMLRKNIDRSNASFFISPHYFLTSGYVFDVTRSVKVKPNVLLKGYSGDVFQMDINCNVFLNETLNIGASWRSEESISAMFQFYFQDRFAAGYAYDIPYGNDLARVNNGSHEIMISYRGQKKKIRTINPRFF